MSLELLLQTNNIDRVNHIGQIIPRRRRGRETRQGRYLESTVSTSRCIDYSERGAVELMNYHQTKGREADTVVHMFRSDDYFGPEVVPPTRLPFWSA